jgi:hypothetical protein
LRLKNKSSLCHQNQHDQLKERLKLDGALNTSMNLKEKLNIDFLAKPKWTCPGVIKPMPE